MLWDIILHTGARDACRGFHTVPSAQYSGENFSIAELRSVELVIIPFVIADAQHAGVQARLQW